MAMLLVGCAAGRTENPYPMEDPSLDMEEARARRGKTMASQAANGAAFDPNADVESYAYFTSKAG